MADRKREDVYFALRDLGWEPLHGEGHRLVLTKGDALWASWSRDSGLDGHRSKPMRRYTVTFSAEVPFAVIVAACEAAAKSRPRGGSRG